MLEQSASAMKAAIQSQLRAALQDTLERFSSPLINQSNLDAGFIFQSGREFRNKRLVLFFGHQLWLTPAIFQIWLQLTWQARLAQMLPLSHSHHVHKSSIDPENASKYIYRLKNEFVLSGLPRETAAQLIGNTKDGHYHFSGDSNSLLFDLRYLLADPDHRIRQLLRSGLDFLIPANEPGSPAAKQPSKS